MNAARLLEYFDRIAEAPDAVSRLRKFILDLAIRGKLVEQDQNDESASELLKKIKHFNLQGSKELKNLSLPDCTERSRSMPCGWALVPLIALGKWAIGSGFPKNEQGCEDGPYFFIKVSDMNLPGNEKFIVSANNFINDDSSARMRARIHPKGTVIFPKIGGAIATNKRRILTRGSAIDNNCLGITFWSELSLEWCYLLMVSMDLAQYQAGTAVPALQQGVLGKIPVFLPPLAEQHRIVAKVDELMTLCDRLEASQAKRESRRDRCASASLKRIGQPEDVGNGQEFRDNVRFHLHHLPRLATRPEHVKELRQTILNLAVRGKLVPQDPNDEPASVLLNIVSVERKRLLRTKKVRNIRYDDVIREDDRPFPLPVGWSWVRFGDLILDSDSGWSPQTESFPRSGDAWGVLKVSAVSWDEFKPEQNKQLLSGVVPPDSAKVNEGDFLISRANTSALVAKCVIVCSCPDNLIMSDKIVRLYFARECNKYYFKVVNNYADYARMFYSEKSTGTSSSMQNVTRQQIYSLPIPLPPLAEQHRIVAKVDELMNLCDKLEVHLATNQANKSRLLEATLCDALGVTCLPVSRPSRPAPSPTRVASTHNEQPPKSITPRPVPFETPMATVQGSLIEQPTQQVGKPRAAYGDVPGAILGQMQPGQEYSRAQLTEALGISVYEWNMAIRELRESGRVVQTGERRGARYSINLA